MSIFKLKRLSKSNIYGRLLVLTLISGSLILVMTESSVLTGDEYLVSQIAQPVTLIVNLAFNLHFYQLLRILHYPKMAKITFIIFLVVFGFMSPIFFSTIDLSGDHRILFAAPIHLIAFCFEVFMSLVILKDIFQSKHTRTNHIWGAIVSYFLIVAFFAEIYSLINVFIPGMLGDLYEGSEYLQCQVFSFNASSGLDFVHSEAHDLFKKIAIYENTITTLYLVVILGRLLSHPLKLENSSELNES